MRPFMDITRALADENRVRMLLGLRERPLCVCQLVEFCGLAPSTASKHLSILRQAGLIESRKQGRWVHYRLADADAAPPEARQAIEWVCRCLCDSPAAIEDAARLRDILKEDPEVLCKRQMARSGCCSSAPATPAGARWPKDGPKPSRPTSSKRTRPEPSRRG